MWRGGGGDVINYGILTCSQRNLGDIYVMSCEENWWRHIHTQNHDSWQPCRNYVPVKIITINSWYEWQSGPIGLYISRQKISPNDLAHFPKWTILKVAVPVIMLPKCTVSCCYTCMLPNHCPNPSAVNATRWAPCLPSWLTNFDWRLQIVYGALGQSMTWEAVGESGHPVVGGTHCEKGRGEPGVIWCSVKNYTLRNA